MKMKGGDGSGGVANEGVVCALRKPRGGGVVVVRLWVVCVLVW